MIIALIFQSNRLLTFERLRRASPYIFIWERWSHELIPQICGILNILRGIRERTTSRSLTVWATHCTSPAVGGSSKEPLVFSVYIFFMEELKELESGTSCLYASKASYRSNICLELHLILCWRTTRSFTALALLMVWLAKLLIKNTSLTFRKLLQ